MDHSKSPCEEDFVPQGPQVGSEINAFAIGQLKNKVSILQGFPLVVFIQMDDGRDFRTWLHMAKVSLSKSLKFFNLIPQTINKNVF